MGTTVVRRSSAQEFLTAAQGVLAAREAEHGLLLGLAATIADPVHAECQRRLGLLDCDGALRDR
jgi:hypothetical protein